MASESNKADKGVDFINSAFSRFMKLGSLTGKVGTSYLGQSIKGWFTDEQKRKDSLIKLNIKNATRLAETLGEMKGAVMKIGQMISLQSEILPKEMAEILSSVQKQAPPVSFEVIRKQIETEFDTPMLDVFKDVSPVPYASASIGQVHLGTLKDNQNVVIKVQYPDVDKMVESDIKAFRRFGKIILQPYTKMDMDIIFDEVRTKMIEELDYQNELRNMKRFQVLFKNDPRIRIPNPVEEYSTKRILTMELIEGYDSKGLKEQCGFHQDQINAISEHLVDVFLRQIFEFRLLHADPNMANFAFDAQGNIIIYDFGCVKEFEEDFIRKITRLVTHVLDKEYGKVEEDCRLIGLTDDKTPSLGLQFYKDYADAFAEPFIDEDPYNFPAGKLHLKFIEAGKKYWSKSFHIKVPKDLVFLNRTLGGMYGNLCQLKAVGRWGQILRKYLK